MATIIEREGRFQAVIRRKGHRPIFKTFPNKRTAQHWAQLVEAEIALGQYQPPPRTTVAELLEKYQRVLPPRESRRCALLVVQFGQLWVDALTSKELGEFRDMRLAEGRAVQTVRHDLGLLNRAIKWGNSELGLRMPLLPSVRLPGRDNRRTRYLTLGEANAILRGLRSANAKGATRAAIILAYYTGMRRSELARFDLEDDVLFLKRTKNGEPRVLNLRPRCLCCAKILVNNPPNVTNLSRAFAKAVVRAQIPHAVFHDLRHTAITNLFIQGLTIPEVAAVSGHKTWAMLARYTHLEKATYV